MLWVSDLISILHRCNDFTTILRLSEYILYKHDLTDMESCQIFEIIYESKHMINTSEYTPFLSYLSNPQGQYVISMLIQITKGEAAHTLRLLYDMGLQLECLYPIAVYYNQLDLLEWCKKHRIYHVNNELFYFACKLGHLEIARWLHKEGIYNWDPSNFDEACKNNHLELIKWLGDIFPGCHTPKASEFAVERGYLDIAEWLFLEMPTMRSLPSKTMQRVASRGDIQMIKLLDRYVAQGNWRTSVMDEAAIGNAMEVVEYLHQYREEGCTENAMEWCAWYGHIPMLDWLHKNTRQGCSYLAMNYAAENGRLEVLKWLHDRQIRKCSPIAIENAAAKGHLLVVQWLLTYYPHTYTLTTIYQAIINNRLEVLKYLYQRSVIDWSHDEGACIPMVNIWEPIQTPPASIYTAVGKGSLDTIRWLHAQINLSFTEAHLAHAVVENRNEMILFLLHECHVKPTLKVIEMAIRSLKSLIILKTIARCWTLRHTDRIHIKPSGIKNMTLERLEFVFEIFGAHRCIFPGIPRVFIKKMIKYSKFDIIRWLCNRSDTWMTTLIDIIHTPVQIDMVLLLLEKLILENNMSVLEWLYRSCHSISLTYHIIDRAIIHNRLDIIKYIYEDGHTECTLNAFFIAGISQNLSAMKWLSRYTTEVVETSIGFMVDYIHLIPLPLLRWYHSHLPVSFDFLKNVSINPSCGLKTLQFFDKILGPSHVLVEMNAVIEKGDVVMFDYLYQKNPQKFNPRMLHVATRANQFNIVKYICEKVKRVNIKPLYFKNIGGLNLDILSFLKEQKLFKLKTPYLCDEDETHIIHWLRANMYDYELIDKRHSILF